MSEETKKTKIVLDAAIRNDELVMHQILAGLAAQANDRGFLTLTRESRDLIITIDEALRQVKAIKQRGTK